MVQKNIVCKDPIRPQRKQAVAAGASDPDEWFVATPPAQPSYWLERNGARAGVVVMALRWTDYLSSASPEAAAKAALLSSCDCRVENENKNFWLTRTVFEILPRFCCKQKWKWLPKIRKWKWYFYPKLKAKTISISTDCFRKLSYLSGNLPPVLPYLKHSPSLTADIILVW